MKALLLVIVATILSFSDIAYSTDQADENHQTQNISMFANVIKNNAKLVMDASMSECTNITVEYSTDGWGWRHPKCRNTSPFPIYDIASNALFYNIDTANFTSTVSTIIANVSSYCPYTGQTATTVMFNCATLGITGLQYKTSVSPTSNTVANTRNIFTTPHTTGTAADFLNFLDFPSAVYIQYKETLGKTGQSISHYDMINTQSNITNVAYKVDMTDLYLERIKKSRENLIALDTALSNYALGAMTAEYVNPAPAALASKDTFFVPWIWQSLATTQAGTQVLCDNSTSCSSIVLGAQWATGPQTDTFAKAWMLITANLLSSNTVYAVDAFGNPLRILPIANNCTGDVSGCVPSTDVPPLPQGSYLTAMIAANYMPRPPFTSLIVSPLCMANTEYPDFCRWTVIYSN